MPPCFPSWSFCSGATLVLQTLGGPDERCSNQTCHLDAWHQILSSARMIVIPSSSLNRVILYLNQGNCNSLLLSCSFRK